MKQINETLIHLIHSDKSIITILETSNKYFEINTEIRDSINNFNRIINNLLELTPFLFENFGSGCIFPIVEAAYELESSIVFCKIGFYKHAIVTLRNILELGLLSVYWDLEDKSYLEIKEWFNSKQNTPFLKEVFKKFSKNSYYKSFDNLHNLFNKTSELYKKLSDFSHTKGILNSSRTFNKYSNFNNFSDLALNKWFKLSQEVVLIITIFHVIKYPIALQNTPLWDKFGENIPFSGFIEPFQSQRIKDLIPSDMLKDLQKISDSDPKTITMNKWVNDRPDIK